VYIRGTGNTVRHTSTALAAILFLGALTSARGQYLEATIPVGDTPTLLFWNRLSNRVYCSNEQSGTVTVIDGATNAVRATINVADYPGQYALAPRHNKVYCASSEGNRVNVICVSGDSLLARLRIPDSPLDMAYSETSDLLYVTRSDTTLVDALDASADTLVAHIDIRHPGWTPIAWSPVSDRLFCASPSGRCVAVVDCSTNAVVHTWPLEVTPRQLRCHPSSGVVYVACKYLLYVFSPDGDSLIARVPHNVYAPATMAYYPVLNRLYVLDLNLGPGLVLDCATNSVIDSLPNTTVGDGVCDTLRGKLYVIDRSTDRVLVYRLADGVYLRSIQLGRDPVCMAWNPVNSRVYVTDDMDNVVYVIRDTTTAVSGEVEVAVARRAGSRIVRGVLKLGRQFTAYGSRPELLDVTGRKMLDLKAGDNDVSRLVAGVYFVRRLGPAEPADLERVLLVR
jgi:YVTN family beta-propeller protein